MKFSEVPKGLFRWHRIVCSKFSDSQAVIITSGKIIDIQPDEDVEEF